MPQLNQAELRDISARQMADVLDSLPIRHPEVYRRIQSDTRRSVTQKIRNIAKGIFFVAAYLYGNTMDVPGGLF